MLFKGSSEKRYCSAALILFPTLWTILLLVKDLFITPSILSCWSDAGSWWQQYSSLSPATMSNPCGIWWDGYCIISPACSGSTSWSPTCLTCSGNLRRKMPRRHPDLMPKAHLLASFDANLEHWSILITLHGSKSMCEWIGECWHALKWLLNSTLYNSSPFTISTLLQLYSFMHYQWPSMRVGELRCLLNCIWKNLSI